MVFGLVKSQVVPYDVLSDVVSSVAGIAFFLFLVNLYLAYGRPRGMKVTLAGIALLTTGAVFNMANDIYRLSWVMRYLVLNFFDVSGAVVSATGITILVRNLFELTSVDALTGCYNRRFLQKLLNTELAWAKRDNSPLSLLFIDLDKFKLVNDQMGHPVGDTFLQRLAVELRNNIRVTDILGRWGGDEFVVVFPRTDGTTAGTLAQRLSDSINGLQKFAVSAGVATYPDDGTDAAKLISVADQRMYQNKRKDRPPG